MTTVFASTHADQELFTLLQIHIRLQICEQNEFSESMLPKVQPPYGRVSRFNPIVTSKKANSVIEYERGPSGLGRVSFGREHTQPWLAI